MALWKCPKCKREFTRKNQRHLCAVVSRDDLLKGRPESVRHIYHALVKMAGQYGRVEIVAKQRYVLLRSQKIFTDLSIMKDCLRVAIHIGRRVDMPMFIKIVSDRKQVSHVAKIKNLKELKQIEPYLKEAYEFSMQ